MAGGCPSLRELEDLASGTAAGGGLEAHVETCAGCADQLAEIVENQRFLAEARGALQNAAADETRSAGRRKPPPSLLRIPGYELREEVSRGGQGVVYRAVQIATKRPAAVKMLLTGAMATARQRARFEREIEIAARLRHPNIVTVFESGEAPGGLRYVAMEYVRGIPLDDYVAAELPHPSERSRGQIDVVVRLVAAVAGAVGHAHTSGVIHRDLKPSNVMVDREGCPRVLDFGLARPVAESEQFSMTQEFVGTPAFAAPEQFGGDDPVDARTDVYGLGLILYRLLTGSHPYPQEGSFADVARHAAETAPEPLTKFSPRLPKDIETIVLKCLSKEPARRYPSASALEADLNHYLRGEAVDARRDSAWYMLQKAAGQNRRLLVGAAVVATVFVVNAVLLTNQVFKAGASKLRAELEQQRAESESRRSEATLYLVRSVMARDMLPGGVPTALGRDMYFSLDQLNSQLMSGAFAAEPDLEYAMQATMGAVFAETPHLAGAGEVSARASLTSRLRMFGPDHPETARGYHDLSEILTARKRYVEAEDAAQSALRIRRDRLGETAAESDLSREQLARILLARGDTKQASELIEAAISRLKQRGQPARRQVLILRTGARVAAAGGAAGIASERIWAALAWAIQNLPDGDVLVVEAIGLATKMFSDEQVEKLRRTIGCGSMDEAREWLQNLGSELGSGRGSRPRSSTLRDLLLLRRAILDEDDVSHCRSLMVLGSQFHEENRFEEAGEQFRLAAPLIERKFGPRHLLLANCYEQIGIRKAWLQRYDEAAELVGQSLRIWAEQPELERDDLTIALATRYTACLYGNAGEFERAERMNLEALEMLQHLVPPGNYVLGTVRAQLAYAVAGQGRYSEAVSLAERALEEARGSEAVPEDQMGAILGTYGICLSRAGFHAEAIDYLRQAVLKFQDMPSFYYPGLYYCDLVESARWANDPQALRGVRWRPLGEAASSNDSQPEPIAEPR